MPLFEEDPALLSKSRLRSDLVAHNVALPPAKSKKEVYVELHIKHIDQRHAADFSSDEEEQVHEVEDKDEDPEDTEIPDPSSLTDDDLKAALLAHGVKAGPIVASTRALYEKKLRTLLQSSGHDGVNGAETGALYSDSEEEEGNGEEENKESGSEGEEEEETVEQSEQAQEESEQAQPSRNKEPAPKRNSGNALKSSERGRSHRSQIPAGITKASSVDQLSGLGSGMESRTSLSSSPYSERGLNGSNVQDHWSRSSRLDKMIEDEYNVKNKSVYYTPKKSLYEERKKPVQEPVKDALKDLFADTPTTPTGISASRRRPIKGAAGRPIQYAYPDTPASPATLERQEVERRLVPIHIQIVVFLIVACLLYLIYVFVEDDPFSPVTALLESLTQESDSEEGLFLQADSKNPPPLSE